jgi:hypothetical protein
MCRYIEGGDGRCEVEHGSALSVEAAWRIACDASLVPVVEHERGHILNVGRETRSVSAAWRRALNARDSGPGRTLHRFTDPHHLADGSETKSGGSA